MESILDLSAKEARKFFLDQRSYCNISLPTYFNFQPLLNAIADSNLIPETNPSKLEKLFAYSFQKEKSSDVNFQFYANKDGEFAWRRLQLINPIAYVYLVFQITEEHNWKLLLKRFKDFQKNSLITCCSIPISKHESNNKTDNIMSWWQDIEQRSIELSMDYTYMFVTDISNCYGSFYTHSIAWAIHKEEYAKNHRKEVNLGNMIDAIISHISYGQTNGLPQGSVLMDFIAEIILGYADLLLSKALKKEKVSDYRILRYRDDYRIFANEKEIAIKIAKLLTETLAKLNLVLNANKTLVSDNIIHDSVKHDKIHMISKAEPETIQKKLLAIHKLSLDFPNSGSVDKYLGRVADSLTPTQLANENLDAIVSILVDIAFRNPRTYPMVIVLIGKILPILNNEQAGNLFQRIDKKFQRLPNTEFLDVWMQRLIIKDKRRRAPNNKLCKYAKQVRCGRFPTIKIWKVQSSFDRIFRDNPIVDINLINRMPQTPETKEVKLFWHY